MIELSSIFGTQLIMIIIVYTIMKDRITSGNKQLQIIVYSVSPDTCDQDIRLEVGESTTIRSGKVDWKGGFCKQVEITMLNLNKTLNGFEYNYTMRIDGEEYRGALQILFMDSNLISYGF